MTQTELGLLGLIDLALGGDVCCFTYNPDWNEVMSLAAKHGVLGLAVDGVERLPKENRPQSSLLLQWFGPVVKQEQQFAHSWKVAQLLSKWWKSVGVEALVLKGRSLAQYYPKPEHRYSCDLDVFIAEGWDRACDLLRKKGVKLSLEIYKEAEFTLDGVYVECHRFITPIRGNKRLQQFEPYLRDLLKEEKQYFEGTFLIMPPLMFNVMLYIEHALGDFLHGKLLLKHLVDWTVLRRQPIDKELVKAKCSEFGFDRFLSLLNGLADVIENKTDFANLPASYQREFEGILRLQVKHEPESMFARRVNLFCTIIRNRRRYRNFGYCSMPSFLWNAVFSHWFQKDVEVIE